MVGAGLALAVIAVLGGVVAYLMTGGIVFLTIAAIGLVAGASGYVLTLGRWRPR